MGVGRPVKARKPVQATTPVPVCDSVCVVTASLHSAVGMGWPARAGGPSQAVTPSVLICLVAAFLIVQWVCDGLPGQPLQATPPVLICLVTASVHCAVGMGPILWEGLLGLEDHYKLCHLSIGFDICSNGISDCAVGMGRPARAGGSS